MEVEYETQNNPNRIAAGISGSVPFNHLWPVVAGGGGMTTEKALDLALEALETWKCGYPREWDAFDEEAITAIKQARSAPVQEPLQPVWNNLPSNKDVEDAMRLKRLNQLATPPAAQRQWVGLTDEDKLHIEIMGGKSDVMLAEMVEAKLKEKNNG